MLLYNRFNALQLNGALWLVGCLCRARGDWLPRKQVVGPPQTKVGALNMADLQFVISRRFSMFSIILATRERALLYRSRVIATSTNQITIKTPQISQKKWIYGRVNAFMGLPMCNISIKFDSLQWH